MTLTERASDAQATAIVAIEARNRPIKFASKQAKSEQPWSRKPVPDELVEAAWTAYLVQPTKAEAARAAGITDKQLTNRLSTYMRAHGLTGNPSDHRRAYALGRTPPTADEQALLERTRPFVEALEQRIESAVPAADDSDAPVLPGVPALEGVWHELSSPQARLVLSGAIAPYTVGKSIDIVDSLLAQLYRHGFELVIRLVDAPA